MRESTVVAVLIVCVALILTVMMIWAGTTTGRDVRRKSIECVKVGGSWSITLDRCEAK